MTQHIDSREILELAAKALRLAVRNAESRLHHAAPLGACYGQPERATLEAELNQYRTALEALEERESR